MAWAVPDGRGSITFRDYLVSGWRAYVGKSGLLRAVVCGPQYSVTARIVSNLPWILPLVPHDVVRSKRSRILVFNCTSGRSGPSFLGAMLAKSTTLLKAHGREDDAHQLFDQVIFCANVTYASGNWKGGV